MVVDGVALKVGATAVKLKIGYVPQDLAIYPDLSAREVTKIAMTSACRPAAPESSQTRQRDQGNRRRQALATSEPMPRFLHRDAMMR